MSRVWRPGAWPGVSSPRPAARSGCAAPPHQPPPQFLAWATVYCVELGSSTQVGEDGQDPAVVGGGGGEAELAEDAGDVLLDRALGDDQALGDGGAAAALGHEGED